MYLVITANMSHPQKQYVCISLDEIQKMLPFCNYILKADQKLQHPTPTDQPPITSLNQQPAYFHTPTVPSSSYAPMTPSVPTSSYTYTPPQGYAPMTPTVPPSNYTYGLPQGYAPMTSFVPQHSYVYTASEQPPVQPPVQPSQRPSNILNFIEYMSLFNYFPFEDCKQCIMNCQGCATKLATLFSAI